MEEIIKSPRELQEESRQRELARKEYYKARELQLKRFKEEIEELTITKELQELRAWHNGELVNGFNFIKGVLAKTPLLENHSQEELNTTIAYIEDVEKLVLNANV